MKNFTKPFLDLIIFLIIIIGVNLIYSFIFREVFELSRNTSDKLFLVIILGLPILYIYKKTKHDKSSLIYGVVVGLISTQSTGSKTTLFITLLSIYIIGVIYYYIKQNILENSKTNTNQVLDFNDFCKIGIIDNFDPILFSENKELKLNRNSYKMFKPILIQKIVNENIILDFSNKEDLNFSIVINIKKEVYIKHRKKVETEKTLNTDIFNTLKNVCLKNNVA